MTRLGILVDPIFASDELIEIARSVEGSVFSSFWYPDEKFFRDCYIGLSLVAAHTQRIRLGPCVTDPFARHPILTTVAIASLAEIAPGRTWLGIGAGGRGLAEIGIQPARQATAIREAVWIIRGLLRGESVDYEGQVLSLKNRPLDFKPRDDIGILIGTGHGRLVQQLAGEIADAAMLANYATPETILKGLKWIEKGAKKAGRDLKDFEIISRIDVAVHNDSATACAAVAPKILSVLRASFPDLNYLEDLPEFDLSSKLLEALNRKDYQSKMYYADPVRSAPLIPDVLVDHLAIAGDPEVVAARLRALSDLSVCQEIAIRLIRSGQQTYPEALDLFITSVLPNLSL